MGKNKQMAINMIAQITTFLVNIGIGFFLTPFIVNNIGSEAYGFVGLANNFISYAQIVTVALNSMAGRFITISIHQKKYEETNQYFSSVFIANGIISVSLTVLTVFILLFLDKIISIPLNLVSDVKLLFGFIFLNFLLTIIGAVFDVATFSKNRLDLAAIREIISRILRILVLVVVYIIFHPSVWYIGLAATVSTGFNIVVNILYTKKLLPKVRIRKVYFDFEKIKTLLVSGVWNSFSRLSGIISTELDLLIANQFVGAASMGSLSIAKTIPTMIIAFFGMMASVFAPQLTMSYAQNDIDDMRYQLISSIKILGIFSAIPMAILFAYGDIFYALWMPTQNPKLLQTLSILSSLAFVFVLPLEGIWNVFTAANKVKKTSFFLFFNSIATITVILIAFIFAKDTIMRLYIIVGTSTIFSIVRAFTFLPLYGAHCLNFKLSTFYPAIMKNVLSVAIITFISVIIKHLFITISWAKLIGAAIATTVLSLGLNSVLILGKRERKVLKNIIQNRVRLSRRINNE